MKLVLVAVGRVRAPFDGAIAEYEKRVRRYFSFEAGEVKEHPSHQASGPAEVMEEEGKRLLARVPAGYEIVALHRVGEGWSSQRLSDYLAERAVRATPGVAFLIGGAFGLSRSVLDRAGR